MALSEEAFNQIMSTASLGEAFRGMSAEDEKIKKLSLSTLEKEARLGIDSGRPHAIAGEQPYMQGNDLGPGYSNVNGQKVFNKNKIINDMNQDQMGSYMSDVYDQTLHTDDEGRDFQYGDYNNEAGRWNRHYLENQDEEEGYLYAGHGKQDENLTKWGYAGLGGEERYTPGMAKDAKGNPIKVRGGLYGWESGEQGIDPTALDVNWRLPRQVAMNAEGVIHGNEGMIGQRDMFDDGSKESIARRKELGSGASEYYNQGKDSPLYQGADGESSNMEKVTGIRTTMDVDKIKKGLPKGATRKQKNEAILANLLSSDVETADSVDGELYSLAKGAAAGVGNIAENVLDTATEATAFLGEKAGLFTEKEKKIMGEFYDSDVNKWNEWLNVDTRYVDKANRELVDNIEKGDYLGAALSMVTNLHVHLAQSAPEMGALTMKIPGLIAAVNSRVKDVSEEFEKNRGREPTAWEEAGMWASAAAVLIPEKILMVGPLKAIFKSTKAAAKGTGPAKKGFMAKMNKKFDDLEGVIPKGKSLGGSAKVIGTAAGGEVLQEIADQAQETGWKEGRMLTGNEAIAAGIAGGVMGGALKGAAETRNIAKNAEESYRKYDMRKNVDNMSKEDFELRKEDAKEMMAENDRNIENSERAYNETDKAKSFADFENSENTDIGKEATRIVRKIKKEIENDKDFYARDDVQAMMKENLEGLKPRQRKRVTKSLGLEENATNEEILSATKKAEGDPHTSLFNRGSEGTESDKTTIINNAMDAKFEESKEAMKESFVAAGADNKTKREATKAAYNELAEVRNSRRKKGKTSKRESGEIDTSEKALNQQETSSGSKIIDMGVALYDGLKSITGVGSTVNKRVATKLNKYDNDSIRNAMKKAGKDSNIERIGNILLEKRANADAYAKDEGKANVAFFDKDSTHKGANFQTLKKLVSQPMISNPEEKAYINRAIDAIETRGDISSTQATIMRNRLEKNRVGSKPDRIGIKDKKLFSDSNDIKADLKRTEDLVARLKREDGGSGANAQKIQTGENDVASLKKSLEKELKYEADNNITPEPAFQPHVKSGTNKTGDESGSESTDGDPLSQTLDEINETTTESTESTESEPTSTESTDSSNSTSNSSSQTESKGTKEATEDASPKHKDEKGTSFTEKELIASNEVSEGFEVGESLNSEEFNKIIEC